MGSPWDLKLLQQKLSFHLLSAFEQRLEVKQIASFCSQEHLERRCPSPAQPGRALEVHSWPQLREPRFIASKFLRLANTSSSRTFSTSKEPPRRSPRFWILDSWLTAS